MWEKGIMWKRISRDAVARWLVGDIVNAEIKSLEKRFDDLRDNVNAIISGGVYRGEERQEGLFGDVDRILTITQAEYDALPEKDKRTLYLVKMQEGRCAFKYISPFYCTHSSPSVHYPRRPKVRQGSPWPYLNASSS